MEYILLKLMTDHNPVFLADLFKYKSTWTRWNIFTGYTGATLWILLPNLLFYHALFKLEKINWIICVVAVLIILGPLIYSLNSSNAALAKADVLNFYSGHVEIPFGLFRAWRINITNGCMGFVVDPYLHRHKGND